MATTIRHKRSAVAGKKPTIAQLQSGELALNTADGKVYLLRDDNTVQDITKRIFEGNSEIKIDDLADSTEAAITMTVNDVDKMTITNAGFNIKDNIDIEDAGLLTFRELTASGEDGVGLKAPNTLDAGYQLTLPPNSGSIGQLMAVDATGNLFFNDADIFGGNVIYVSAEQGDDENDGQSAPVKTVKRACQLACAQVYNADGTINFKRINIKVAVGDYTEDNPVIVPDNTVIKGDGLRGCIIRPANANLDMLRVRNACYFGEFTFRDGVDSNFVPLITADYAVAFDDPTATDVADRADYPNLPSTKPTITTSPYIQNASIISFLGMNGAKIDGSKVESPNVPVNQIEAENPVVGAIPEQGKSMVANAFTILSFGGTAWRLTNDAYAQIVSCFEIFLLNGVYTQSGGYCSITNSATNFGLYALRSSGYSPKAFEFDRSFANATGAFEGKQTITMVGLNRDAPVEEFVLRFREAGYKEAFDVLTSKEDQIAQDTVTWINQQIAAATQNIWAGFTYNEEKCRRDVRLLLDAIRFDIMFNSNYRTISSAIKYYNGTSNTVLNDQREQTIESFTQAKAFTAAALNDATAVTRANALWDEVLDIIENGSSNDVPGEIADTYVYPTPSFGTGNASDAGYANAVQQLLANKEFIKKEVTGWIADQVTAGIPPFATDFNYSEAKCERDTSLIIDALIYDLTYGGNLLTRDAAIQYFVGASAQYGDGKKEETLAAYVRLKDVIGDVILETAVTVSSGNTETQDTSGTAGSAAASTQAETLVQIIVDHIDNDGGEIVRSEPDTSWPAPTLVADVNNAIGIDSAGAVNIAQRVTQYINDQIDAGLWYNFVYDQSKCLRDTKLIVDAVAKDTWDTGNRYSRNAGLAYFNANIADSSRSLISGQELQTIKAIERAAVLANAEITGYGEIDATIEDFVQSRFNIITDIIRDPDTIPNPEDVSSEGDVTLDFIPTPDETTFDAATDLDVDTGIFTITGHGFSNLQKVIYDNNGNATIGGLNNEQTYYIKIIDENEFTLTNDDSGEFDATIFANFDNTGNHKFLANIIEFFVEEITDSHTTYQKLILESGAENYYFKPGRAISGATGASNNSAIVSKWVPAERELTVSVEQVTVGQSLLRIQFDATSTITEDHSDTPNTAIGVNETSAVRNRSTATFSITATDGSSSISNTGDLPEKQLWFHRPSIVNSSSHTWEYAGSGTDYNALPQNGGNTREEFEQFEELPGRCYSSGTNELGDFKVGDFITAFNRTGNITFRNKVQVDELDALKLSVSDVAIEEISTDVNLGDNEIGGASNNRISTQLATRAFLSNRLGGFIDKTVSSAAVPGAIVQLNVNGQLNADLIPATRQFTNTNTKGYQSRLQQVEDIPAVDLKAGDIGTEEYEQVELTMSGTINASDGDLITQSGVVGAIAYAKGDFPNSGTILVATVGEAWDKTDDSVGDPWEVGAGNILINGVDSGENITGKGLSSEIIDNYFLRSSNSSQYLLLDSDETYTFTSASVTNVARSGNIATITTSGAHNLNIDNNVRVLVDGDDTYNQNGLVVSVPSTTTFTISNTGDNESSKAVTGTARTIVTSADGNAQGEVTELREGIAGGVDNANITGGTLYTPTTGSLIYENVSLTSVTGSGAGAKANITVTAGTVSDVDLTRGGLAYQAGDLLGANASDIGGTGSGFQIEVSSIEDRAYVNIVGGELFVASSSSIDFVEDNSAVQQSNDINFDDQISRNFLVGTIAGGGAVNYTDSRITITAHGLSDGDPVTYDTLANVAIGGLLNDNVYYVKVVDNDTIELYDDFSLITQITFLTTPANNNHNITRFTVNLTDNSTIVKNHGFTTGDAIRMVSLDDGSSSNVLPDVNGVEIASGSRFFVGSVTTNSFTIHALRSDALSSINGLVTNSRNIDANGVGSARVIRNNVQVNAIVNTSSRLLANWNTLAVTNIDAENIISGTISPSRLAAAGVANTETALFGSSEYKVVVQTLKKAATTDNPVTLTGLNIAGEFYGDPVNIGISNVDLDPGGTFSTLGVSRFLQTQFDVNANASGEVFIKDGVVDAGTLDSLDSAYFLNPNNLTSLVPVSRGGTNISTYAIGDIVYAQSAGSLNTLNIGRANTFLKSNGTVPEWGTALDLAEGLDVGSAKLSSSSDALGQVYNQNVTTLEIGGDAENVKIGKSTDTRNITTFALDYEATASRDVVVNLSSLDVDTFDPTANGENTLIFEDTTGIKYGMTVTGSGSIPANTTVTGVTETEVFISADTTGTVLTGTTLTFNYTPETLGIRNGDTIIISGSNVTNLDGTWPVSGATVDATSFTIRTDDLVTAANVVVQGTISKDNTMVIRNRDVVFGSAVTGATPASAVLKGESGLGTNIGGGDITIQGGLSTGNATSGSIIVKTGEAGTSGDLTQTATTRLTIDTAGKATFTGEVEVDATVSTSETTVALLDDTATTINMGGEATTIEIGAATGTTTVHNNVDIDLDLNVDGGDITTNATTFNIVNANATTVNIGGDATNVSVGASTGTTTVNNDLTVTGDLTVNGTTTTINTTELSVDDKNIELGALDSPTDVTADGGGITLKGATDKTINWINSTDSWTSSENFELASGKQFRIDGNNILSSTTIGATVVNSSLQQLGTVNTGIWQATIIDPTYGGTGVNNGSKTITLGGNFTHTGAHSLGITTTGNTSVTMPTSGTLARIETGLNQFASTTSAQLAGVISNETGSGSLVFATSPEFTNGIEAASVTMALFDDTATTINFGGVATSIDIGATTGTTSVNNNLDVDGDLNVDGGDITTNQGTFNLLNINATTVNAFGSATALDLGASSGTTSINNDLDIDGDLNVDGGDITTNTATSNIMNANATTINLGGGASTINIGASTSSVNFADDVDITGNLTIDGTLDIPAIDDVPIGSITPSSGAFTTLTASGLTTVTNTTSATSTSTGAVVITGGLGVGGAVHASSYTGSIAASNIDSGTLDDARIAVSNVTQHQASITGTGALNSGSISTGFGNINIGTSTFSGNGSGLTDLNASQLTTGTVQGVRLGGNQTMAGVKTFSDTSDASNSTSGALRIGGGLGVAKKIYTGTGFYGNGANITALNATNIGSGTIADGRLPNSQAGKSFTSDITVNGHRVGRGNQGEATNLVFGEGGSIGSGAQFNTGIGDSSFAGGLTGDRNTALGYRAMNAITTQSNNTAVGANAMEQRSSAGAGNTAVGKSSQSNSTAGNYNTSLGIESLELVTGDNNTVVGAFSGDTLTGGSNNILLGYNVETDANTTNNQMVIGNSSNDSLKIPGVNLTVSTTTFNFSGTNGYSGVGTSLTALNASQLSSGTVPDGRISSSSVTQHETDIDAVGTLAAGAISSGFGNIDIGSSNLTATGSVSLGATALNGNSITGVEDIALADRIYHTGDTNTYMQFSAADTWRVVTGATARLTVNNTTTTVAGNLSIGGTASGNGSGLTSLNASNLGSGTVANARISGSYTGITGTGALNAGSITSGFGNVNIGTNTFTGNGSGLTNVDAATLDGIDSTGFVAVGGDTMTGVLTFNNTGTASNNAIKFGPGPAANDDAHIEWRGSSNAGSLRISTSDDNGTEAIEFGDYDTQDRGGSFTQWLNMNRSTFTWQSNTIWHAGNDGPGSGLDADSVDGIAGSSLLRSDANDSASGTYDYTSTSNDVIDFTGAATSDNRGISFNSRTALSADQNDGWLRINNASEFSNGIYTPGNFRADGLIRIDSTRGITNVTGDYGTIQTSGSGTGNWEGYSIDGRIVFMHDGATSFGIYNDVDNEWALYGIRNSYTELRYNGATRIRANNTSVDITGAMLATGEVTAYSSDERLKTNISPIENAIDKVKRLNGVHYDWIDEVEEMGFSPRLKHNDAGVIAQDVQKVLPQAVDYAPFDRLYDEETGADIGSKSGEDYLTVKYEKMVPLLIEAIKEQQDQIDELKEMVRKLTDK